jgi:uncharacterized membrane protein
MRALLAAAGVLAVVAFAMLRVRPARGAVEERVEEETRELPGRRFVREEEAELELASESRLARNLPALLGLALIAALVPASDVWAAQLALLVLLLTVPGALLLRALRVSRRAVAGFPVYVPCASLVVLTASALAVDLIGPLAGLEEPLRELPLLVSLEAVCLALAVAAFTAPREAGVPLAMLPPRPWFAWPLLLPAAAAAGAVLMSDGQGRAVAIAAVAAAVVVVAGAALRADRLSPAHLQLLLYGAGLALVWSFTLRGEFVYGFDIHTEYQVVDFTLAEGVWNTGHEDDAYGAMLSLTVLPALLGSLTGISEVVLLKAVYPALFALFPVAVFGFARRFVAKRWAFLAAAFVVAQGYFFHQLPGIARQEIALLMFVALVAAVLDRRLRRWSGWTLAVLLALGMVVSHYTTTYMAIVTLAAAVVVQLVVSFRRPLPRLAAPFAVALVAAVAGAGVWYGAVTHSTANLADFVDDTRDRGPDLLPNARPGQSLVQTYLQGNVPIRLDPEELEDELRENYRDERPWVTPWIAGSDSRYDLAESRPPADRVRSAAATEGVRGGQLLASQAFNVLAIIGSLMLAFGRRTSLFARQVGVLALGTLLVLAVARLSGTAAEAYNHERAFLQTMVPLGVGLAWALELAWRRAPRLGRAVPVLAVLGILAIAVNTSGLRGVVAGGGTPTNLANGGEDYERFYVTPGELAGARWLYRVPESELVYADRYGALRVMAATGRNDGLLQHTMPETLDRDAWVYASRANLEGGRARANFGSRFAVYGWPDEFLRRHYDLVYANGTSAVYLGDLAGRDKPR